MWTPYAIYEKTNYISLYGKVLIFPHFLPMKCDEEF